MNGFGVSMVADLCEALAELIEAAPKVATFTARKLGATLRRRVDLADETTARELHVREQRVAKGLPEFG